eukprot:m.911909 g.911909  ORF g.911909 m.911909 type:complete len:97 (-) comp23725_c0_seq36:2669-2959(-)
MTPSDNTTNFQGQYSWITTRCNVTQHLPGRHVAWTCRKVCRHSAGEDTELLTQQTRPPHSRKFFNTRLVQRQCKSGGRTFTSGGHITAAGDAAGRC